MVKAANLPVFQDEKICLCNKTESAVTVLDEQKGNLG